MGARLIRTSGWLKSVAGMLPLPCRRESVHARQTAHTDQYSPRTTVGAARLARGKRRAQLLAWRLGRDVHAFARSSVSAGWRRWVVPRQLILPRHPSGVGTGKTISRH